MLNRLPRGVKRRLDETLLRLLGPENFERLQFWRQVGYWPDLLAPRSFNEKGASMKLYADLPEAANLSDKVEVLDYVRATLGDRYINPVLQVVDDVDSLDFAGLPEQFVIRPSHASSRNLIVHDKAALDIPAARERLRHDLAEPYGVLSNEWWYWLIPPRLLVQPLLEDSPFLMEFKIYVFHGHARAVRLSRMREYYDLHWNRLPFDFVARPDAPPIDPPRRLQEMAELAEALAQGFDFMRVDLYCLNDERIVFSELTSVSAAGWERLQSREADIELGSYWAASWKTGHLNSHLARL